MGKLGRFYILLCWTLAVLILIGFPMPEYEGTKVTLYDKFVHAILFGVFYYLLAFSLLPWRGKRFKLSLIILFSFFVSTAYAGLAEYIQSFVPGRTVSEYDFLGGLAGILFFLGISYAKLKDKKT